MGVVRGAGQAAAAAVPGGVVLHATAGAPHFVHPVDLLARAQPAASRRPTMEWEMVRVAEREV